MKKPNLRDILAKAKHTAELVEHRIEELVGSTEHKVTLLIDEFCDSCLKASEYTPIIASNLQNPIVKSIANFFGASSYISGVCAILNRVAPKLKAISDDKTMFNGAIHHIAAEILVYVKDGEITVDEAIDRIQKLFIPVDSKTIIIPLEE